MPSLPQHSPGGAELPAHLRTSWMVVDRGAVRRQRLLWAGGLLLLVLAVWGAWELGRYQAGEGRFNVAQERAAYGREVADLRRMNRSLRERIQVLETSRDVDLEAWREVESSLAQLQAQLQTREQELQFYQSIVSPEDRVPGLRIQRFQVLPQSASRVLVRLVLVQALRQEERVDGSVAITVTGQRDGQEASLSLAELAPDGAVDLSFSFRYFQEIEQELTLPDRFAPDSVRIELQPDGRGAEPLRETYNWPAGAQEGAS